MIIYPKVENRKRNSICVLIFLVKYLFLKYLKLKLAIISTILPRIIEATIGNQGNSYDLFSGKFSGSVRWLIKIESITIIKPFLIQKFEKLIFCLKKITIVFIKNFNLSS